MQKIIAKLTSKDDNFACAVADKIVSESRDTDEWYEHFDTFASLLSHPKSLVRNRALFILAANAQWDDENRFDAILRRFYPMLRTKSLSPQDSASKLRRRWE